MGFIKTCEMPSITATLLGNDLNMGLITLVKPVVMAWVPDKSPWSEYWAVVSYLGYNYIIILDMSASLSHSAVLLFWKKCFKMDMGEKKT